MAIATGIANLPFSASERARESAALLDDPGGAVSLLGKIARGIKGAVPQAAVPGFRTPDFFRETAPEDTQTAVDAGTDLAETFTSEKLQTDPLAAITTIGAPGSRGLIGTVGKATRAGVSRGAREVASFVTDAAEDVGRALAEIPGFSTGARAGNIVEAFKAGLEGNKEVFLKAVRDQVTTKDIARQVVGKLKEAKGKIFDDLQGFRADLKASGQQVDISDLKRDIVGDLDANGAGGILQDQFDVGVSRSLSGDIDLDFNPPSQIIRTDDIVAIETAIKELLSQPDVIDAFTLDAIKVRLSELFTENRKGGALVDQVRKATRQKLGRSVQDINGVSYDSAMKDLTAFEDLESALREDLSIRLLPKKGETKPPTKAAGKQIGRSLREGEEDALRAVEGLEAKFPELKLRAQISGQALSQLAPIGIVGRGGAATAIGTATVTQFLPVLATLPAFSPKLVGQAMVRAGATAKKAQDVIGEISSLISRARALGIDDAVLQALTIGELLERLEGTEETQRPRTPGVIGTLGRVQ